MNDRDWIEDGIRMVWAMERTLIKLSLGFTRYSSSTYVEARLKKRNNNE